MWKEKIEEVRKQTREKILAAKTGYTNKKKEKEREKRRKGKHRFGQAELKHSTMGIYSCGYAGGSAAILLLSILIAYFTNGKAAGFIGGFGIIALAIAIAGIRAAIKGMRERERKYITCKIGIICNIILTFGLIIIFIGGLL